MNQPFSVWVLDTSAIIAVKQHIPLAEQQRVYGALSQLLNLGQIAYPKQVLDELGRYAEEDLPLQWANAHHNEIQYTDPPWNLIQYVMQQAGDVVDPDKEQEDADPYVLAMALELQSRELNVAVVTEDRRDRPTHIAMATACQRLGLPSQRMTEFLAAQSIWPQNP